MASADLPQEVHELRAGSLSTVDAVAMAIAVLSPAMAMAYNTTGSAAFSGTSTPLAFLLGGIITAKGRKSGRTLAPFTFSHTLKGGFSGVFYGIIFGVLSYIGFETAAVLGEETRNPRRAIPTSIIVAVVFAILFYVWTTYVIAIGVGVGQAGSEKWSHDFTVLATTATTYSGHFLTVLIEI